MNSPSQNHAETPVASPSCGVPGDGQRSIPWLEHEIVFGLFLAATWIRLVVKQGAANPCALVLLGCLLGAVVVGIWAQRNPSPLRWRVRLLYYPAVMGISFFTLEHAVPLVGAPDADGLLLDLDRRLLGETPSLSYMAWDAPWLNDLLMVSYLFFFYYLILGPAYYCIYDLARFRKCFAGLFTLYGVGMFLYTVLPAGGPHLHLTFAEPLEGGVVIPLTLGIVKAGSNGTDVFPSLHFAASFFLLWFDWRHRRRHFWLCLLPCFGLWCGAVLLRFHYFVDLLGGLAVALVGVAAARWHEQRLETAQHLRSPLRARNCANR